MMAARWIISIVAFAACGDAKTWQRAEAEDGAAVVSLPPELVWRWGEDPNVAAVCVTATEDGDDAAIRCHAMVEPGTRPLRVEQLASAAARATAANAVVATSIGVAPVDASGAAAGAPATLGVAVFPPPQRPWTHETPRVLVVWPPAGDVRDTEGEVEIFFHVLGVVPRNALIRIDFTGGSAQPPVFLEPRMISVVLSAVEPATNVMVFSVGLRDETVMPGNDGEWAPLGPAAEMAFDTVLGDAAIQRHRHAPPATRPDASAPPPPASQKLRLVFVGSMTWDGQKTIWLQQIKSLDRRAYDIRYVSFMQDGDAQAKAPLAERLRSLGVPPLFAPIPAIDADEAGARPAGGGPSLADVYNGTQSTLDAYLMAGLEAARGIADRCEPSWVARTWRHLADAFGALDPDVVVFANARDSSDGLLTTAARIATPRAVLVMELPNLFPHAPLDVDVLVAPSHYAATHYSVEAAVAGAAKRPAVAVINPGVDAAVFGPRPGTCHSQCLGTALPAGPNGCAAPCEVVGFLARLAPEKSPGLFVHAAALVAERRPLARFVVVGDGAAAARTKELARLYGIRDRFDFPGAVRGDAVVAAAYAGFDVVVNPSLRAWSETFCIANVEAMAVGVPVVSFGVGGVGEYLRGARDAAPNGVVVDSAEPRALADALIAALEDPAGRAALGANARAAVLADFRVEDQLRKYAVLYARLKARAALADLPWVLSR